jgi:polyisoprenoid-binding protein YceI
MREGQNMRKRVFNLKLVYIICIKKQEEVLMKNLFVLITIIFLSSILYGAEWELDKSHSAINFSVRHLGISNVKGEFTNFEVKVTGDKESVEKSTVEAKIFVDSINTREPKRDEHLKSPDFFDVAKYPTIEFKSKEVKKVSNTKLKVKGDLTMHGITKEVVLDVESPGVEVKDPWGNIRAGFQAKTKLNRKDFGINWNATLDKGGVVVGDTVDVAIDIELIKKSDNSSKEKDKK